MIKISLKKGENQIKKLKDKVTETIKVRIKDQYLDRDRDLDPIPKKIERDE